jgi:DNA-binding phage protein
MNRRKSVSHDQMMRKKLKDDPEFAAEYLKAALQDANEPKVLLIALRRITEAVGASDGNRTVAQLRIRQ